MPHKASEHDEWAKNKRKYSKTRNKEDSDSTKSSSQSLSLTESMKQALMSEGNMTAEQAQACWAKVVSEN